MNDVCDCGKPAHFKCSDIPNITGLVRCERPICRIEGGWCAEHRHAPNTMGYGAFKGTADFEGFVPDGPGFKNWAKNLWRRLTYSPLRTAQYVWDRERQRCEPPAPFPTFELRVGWKYFKSDGARMVEVPEDSLESK
jgi:hypothetical protein